MHFSVFDHMIAGDREAFHFDGRSRRPPLDRVNALLSFVYALLRHDIESALESVGLDPALGFLHTDRPGRPSLALDLMEEMRAALADRLRRVARLCENQGQRVQNAVFECLVDSANGLCFGPGLLTEADPSLDSLRFTFPDLNGSGGLSSRRQGRIRSLKVH